ncbi:MAG: YCF48-related protein [Pyrinomonadaceae bacterium]
MKSNIKQTIGFRFYLLIITLVLTVSSISAAIDWGANGEVPPVKDWEVVGPNGGDVRVVAVDPKDKNRLYVSTLDGQIHTSADGGKTWALLVNFNRPQLVLDQLFVDSRDSRIIYTSGHRHKEAGGFFKTTDGGVTWKESKDLKKESIHAMTQSVFDPNTIIVGGINGVWISTDSGDNFKKIESTTMPINIDSLAIDPRNTTTMYAGTWWRAYKTTDAGKNWRLIKNGMIDDSDVFTVTIDQKNPDHVISSACSGIYESFNGGELWKKIQGIPSQSRRTRDLVQHPSKPGTIYAATTEGFWMTSDGGKTWAITTQKNLEINSITVHPNEPLRVFIGTNNYGIMVSNDGGKNFVPTNDNFTSRLTYSISVDSERSNRLYATTQNTATGGGFVFISNNSGQSWEQTRSLDVARISPYSILQDEANANTMYLGTNVGVFRSLDRGLSWTQLVAPKTVVKKKVAATKKKTTGKTAAKTTTTPAETAVVASKLPGLIPALTEKVTILANTGDGKNGVFAGTDNGLFRSYDVTKGWEKINFGAGIDTSVFVIFVSPNMPGTIWVGTATSGVVVSQDDGKTWRKVDGIPENVPVSSINVNPNKPELMYVGTAQTLYMSKDGGRSWTRRGGNLPLGNYTSILINPKNTDELYISSALQSDGGIYYSGDAGWNWKRVDSKNMNLPSRRVWSLVFDPNDSNRIFAGTHSSGVYRIDREPRTSAESKDTRSRVSSGGN